MLKQENYLSFAIVVGFFLGLMFGIAKFDEPEAYGALDDTCYNGDLPYYDGVYIGVLFVYGLSWHKTS